MADWTAITGIIVSGIVGPSVAAAFALRRQRSDHGHDRERDDLADARRLLDEASTELRRVREIGDTLAKIYLPLGSAFPTRAAATIEEFKQALRDQALTNERLILRFGDESKLVDAHSRAMAGATIIGGALGLFASDEPEFERSGPKGAQVGLSRVVEAHADFRRAAHATIALRPGRAAERATSD